MEKEHQYLRSHCQALHRIADGGDPWVFLCASAMIEYLAKMTLGDGKMEKVYPKFVEEYMAKADKRYKEFRYNNSSDYLPKEMYHILRCGLVHAFSLVPDRKNGRVNSITIDHKAPHFYHRTDIDSCVFNAYNFIADLCKVIDLIFQEAGTNSELKKKIETYWEKYPPLGII